MADLRLFDCDHRRIVAVIFEDDGSVLDLAYNWESAQSYALSQGKRVVAIADDHGVPVADAQRLYDAERDRYRDCFGVTS